MAQATGEGIENLPRLYRDLADWWPVLSAPEEYAEEAEFYRQAIISASHSTPITMLELGSGGGNNASHLKKHFRMILVDLSAGMLDVSRKLNPECEHIPGDMRTIRLGRQFDVVFVHDAISYMTSEADLSSALLTAYEHCKPGGVALFAPDHIKENFKPSTDHGGRDLGVRSMRYLEWTWDPDSSDSTYQYLMVYALREGNNPVECIQDQHVCGLFAEERWLELMRQVGFDARSIPFEHSELPPGSLQVFLGAKRS